MKFTLEQDTIESALRTYLQANYGLSLRNKEAVMSFTAGRGKNGLSVQVNIKDATIPGEDGASENSKPAAIIGQIEPKVSAAEKITTALASAVPGTVGATLQAASTVAVEVKTAEAVADPVAVEEAAPVETKVEAESAPVAVEAEVAAVTTEAAVAAESAPVQTEEAAKPAPKTTSGLFA